MKQNVAKARGRPHLHTTSMKVSPPMRQTVKSPSESVVGRWFLATLLFASNLDRLAMGMLRAALVIVLVWIGGLKFVDYEADSIVPLVANSPVMSFLYRHPAEYRTHMNKEGELNAQHREWHQHNGTYVFSHCLGAVIVGIGLLIALYPVRPELSVLGSGLLILMSCTTLSFLLTTPEAWVPALGDANHGFPYLSGSGRLIVKDFIMLSAAFVTLADSAKVALSGRSHM
jgi:reactive chlorine resistance protein C